NSNQADRATNPIAQTSALIVQRQQSPVEPFVPFDPFEPSQLNACLQSQSLAQQLPISITR
ncbi:MAG: hypothetical protein ACI87A_000701, partial [Planctomycetota bacterium]